MANEPLQFVVSSEIPDTRHMIAGDENAGFSAAILPFLLTHADLEGVAR